MGDRKKGISILAEMEAQVLEEGREWTRKRLAEKLEEQARRQSELFPPAPPENSPSESEDECGSRGD